MNQHHIKQSSGATNDSDQGTGQGTLPQLLGQQEVAKDQELLKKILSGSPRIPLHQSKGPNTDPLFLNQYDLQICLYGGAGQSYSKWEAINKLREIDQTIQMLPWRAQDQHDSNPPIKLTSLHHEFFNLQTYVPRLASPNASLMTCLQLGQTRHPYLFLQSSVHPLHLVQQMGPWLQGTKQGMWPRQIPLAEEVNCLGWLLYSGPEYDLGALWRCLKQDTEVDMTLCFRIINDGFLAHSMHKPQNQSNSLGG